MHADRKRLPAHRVRGYGAFNFNLDNELAAALAHHFNAEATAE